MAVDERDSTMHARMREVSCRRCATPVLVRKNSLAQTTIQWQTDAAQTCTELAQHRAAGVHPALVPACESLRASIDEAVREGVLQVAEP